MTFKPVSGHKSLRVFYLFLAFMWVSMGAVVICYFQGWIEVDESVSLGPAAIPFGFLALLTLVAWSQGTTFGVVYRMTENEIELKRMFARVRIPLSEITNIEVISSAQLQKRLMAISENENQAQRDLDVASAFGNRLKLGRLIQFCTVSPTFSMGGDRRITRGVRVSGEFVLISVRDGSQRVLSPVSCTEMFEAIKGKMAA